MWNDRRGLRTLALMLSAAALLTCVSCASGSKAPQQQDLTNTDLEEAVQLSLLSVGEPELSAMVRLASEAPGEEAQEDPGSADDVEEAIPEQMPEPVLPTVRLSLAVQPLVHQAVMNGYPDGSFQPEAVLTRAEAAQIFYGLLAEQPEDRAACSDVSPDRWYYDAVCLMVSGGALDVTGTEARPEEPITRGEFAALAARLTPEAEGACAYTDLGPEDAYYAEIAKATALGWVSGYADGSFRSAEPITRAEAAAMVDRVLNRTADEAAIPFSMKPFFSDVSQDHWAYDDIMEAALVHAGYLDLDGTEIWTWVDTTWVTAPPVLPEGLYFDGAELYYIGPSGRPVANTYVGSLFFGEDGRYTSGDEEIDNYAKAIVQAVTTPEMTQLEKLRAGFNYVRDSYTYLRRNYYSVGYTDWVMEEARTMYTTGRGNCYCYAGAFYYVARQLGYDARIISGTTGYNRAPHGWVEIDLDGVTYIFDTELEMAYRKKGVYYYDFFMMPYWSVPWPYNK